MSDRPWDPGLQPERTVLAWRRLALALVGVAAVLARVAWSRLGPWSVPAVVVAVVSAAAIWLSDHGRYVRSRRTLTASGRTAEDGRLILLVTLDALLLGLTAATALAVG